MTTDQDIFQQAVDSSNQSAEASNADIVKQLIPQMQTIVRDAVKEQLSAVQQPAGAAPSPPSDEEIASEAAYFASLPENMSMEEKNAAIDNFRAQKIAALRNRRYDRLPDDVADIKRQLAQISQPQQVAQRSSWTQEEQQQLTRAIHEVSDIAGVQIDLSNEAHVRAILNNVPAGTPVPDAYNGIKENIKRFGEAQRGGVAPDSGPDGILNAPVPPPTTGAPSSSATISEDEYRRAAQMYSNGQMSYDDFQRAHSIFHRPGV